jgi:hypothetical protein
MIGLLCFELAVLASPFKSKLRLEARTRWSAPVFIRSRAILGGLDHRYTRA